ncbi:MAG TPA: PilW family protein [Casimicrobiaceae bacterium]|jgi:type IV pilus assembly protein PilW
MKRFHRANRLRAQVGFSLIEIMVGIVIGMIAVLVIYQVFSAAEGLRRNTTSVGDAQQNGLLSSFMLNIEVANASNGIADAMTELGACAATADIATTFRPIPLLITDGGASSDSFTVNYSLSQRVVTPVQFSQNAAAGAPYEVISPNGFKTDDLILAISSSTPAVCDLTRVVSVAADPGSVNPLDQLSGQVKVTHTGAPDAFTADAVLLNLGPKSSGQRVTFDVNAGVLRSTSLWDSNGAPTAQPPNPIASNVVMMKLMYGIDNGAGGVTWNAAVGAWSPANVLAADNTTLKKIRAIRLGIVVQGEQFDKALALETPSPTWTLFTPDVNLTGALLPGFRYRTYETIIPLRNPVWNS